MKLRMPRSKVIFKRILVVILVLTNLLTGFPLDLFTNQKIIKTVDATITPSGVAVFSETAADDNLQFLSFTSASTYTDRGNSVDTTTNTNDLFHNIIRRAPTRNEMMSAQLESNGTLHVTRCVGSCDASGDWTEELEISGVTGTLTCDSTVGSCWQNFDIAYEQLSGDAIVFYGKTANDGVLYYNVWDGTSWAGESSHTFNNGSTVDTLWIKARAQGERLDATRRTNRILVMVKDDNNDIDAIVWSGSAFGNETTITTTSSADTRDAMDGAWEGPSGQAIVVWGEGTSNVVNPFRYKVFDGSSTWDSSASDVGNIFTGASVASFVELTVDPNSNRIAAMFQVDGTVSSPDIRPAIWKSDGTTAGWTFGTEDASTESWQIPSGGVAWEKYNSGTSFAMFVNNDVGTSDLSDYQTYTAGTGFAGPTDMPGAAGDDGGRWKLVGSPNNDEIIALAVDMDDDLCFQRWSGTAWDADCTTTEYSTTIPPDTEDGYNEQNQFDFAYHGYFSWGRNWRFYDDETVNDPSTGLNGAAENVTPTSVDQEEFIRLRYQMVELGGVVTQADVRYKLQYTSGCTPNSDENACTWTDVGDTGETSAVWRYATSGETCASCSDNTAISTARLTGTTQNGAYISDKDAAGGTNMDHTASAIVEYDYPLKAESVAAGTTYYFRIYDLDTRTPVYRRQDTGTTACLSATCTYPSLTTTSSSTSFTLSTYRFYVDNDGTNPTDPWGNPNLSENAQITTVPATNDAPESADEIRLRVAITIGTANLSASAKQFKLQYKAGTDASCTTGSWTDVGAGGGGGIWRFATSSVTDGVTITAVLTPSDVNGHYAKSNPTVTNTNGANVGQDIEYDFHIQHNGAANATTYSFRVTESDGTQFASYTNCPTLQTKPDTANLLRHGQHFVDQSEKGFLWAD